MKTIKDLFNKVKMVLKNKRKENKNFDGKKFWQPIKKLLENVKVNFKWKKLSSTEIKKIMNMPEFIINGYGKQEIIEVNHFIIQTVRIPTTEKPTLKKLIQIGLNIGQFKGTSSKKLPYSNIDNFVSKSIQNMKLDEVLDNNEIIKLEKLLK